MSCCRAYETGKGKGSTWIDLLAKEISTENEAIEVILTNVREKLRDKYRSDPKVGVQQPTSNSYLNKNIYLHHDYYRKRGGY